MIQIEKKKVGVNKATIVHPAEFWALRPPHRPEISISPKNVIFLALGDLPPFVFMDNDKIQKTLFFYLRHVHVYYNQLVQFWFNSS